MGRIDESLKMIRSYNVTHSSKAGINLEEPVRVASPDKINLEEPIRVASPHRINLEEPVRVASPHRINLTLCQSVCLSVRAKRGIE